MPIDALSVSCAQLTRDLLAIAKFMLKSARVDWPYLYTYIWPVQESDLGGNYIAYIPFVLSRHDIDIAILSLCFLRLSVHLAVTCRYCIKMA